MRSSANRLAAARCGWWPHAFRGGLFDFIYVIIEVICTCMQNFKKIDLKKNSTFFIQSCSALFLLQTVHTYVLLTTRYLLSISDTITMFAIALKMVNLIEKIVNLVNGSFSGLGIRPPKG